MLITDRSQLEGFDSRYRVWQGIPGIVRVIAFLPCRYYNGS